MGVDLCLAVLLIALLLFLMNPHFTYSSATYVKMDGDAQSFTGARSLKIKSFWDCGLRRQLNGFILPILLAVSFKFCKPSQQRKGVQNVHKIRNP